MVDSTIRFRSGRIRQYEQFFVCALNIGGWYFEVNGFSWGRQLKESNSGKFVYILVDAIRCSEHTHRHTTCWNEKQLCKARMKTAAAAAANTIVCARLEYSFTIIGFIYTHTFVLSLLLDHQKIRIRISLVCAWLFQYVHMIHLLWWKFTEVSLLITYCGSTDVQITIRFDRRTINYELLVFRSLQLSNKSKPSKDNLFNGSKTQFKPKTIINAEADALE